MKDNECIDEGFITEERIAEMPQLVTEKGGFGEFEIVPILAKVTRLETELKAMLMVFRTKAMLVEKYKEKMFRTSGLEGSSEGIVKLPIDRWRHRHRHVFPRIFADIQVSIIY